MCACSRDADTAEARVDIVEEMGRPEILSAHIRRQWRLFSPRCGAPVTAEVVVALHPAEAALLEANPGFDITDYGLDRREARGTVRVTAEADLDVVFEHRGNSGWDLGSLATLSDVRPPPPAKNHRQPPQSVSCDPIAHIAFIVA
jgi:hypothetical protein